MRQNPADKRLIFVWPSLDNEQKLTVLDVVFNAIGLDHWQQELDFEPENGDEVLGHFADKLSTNTIVDAYIPWLAKVVKKGLTRGEEDALKRRFRSVCIWAKETKTDLGRVGLADALEKASGYTTRAERKGRVESDVNPVVYRFADGFKIVQLKTDAALKREGDLLKHCVGGYCEQVREGTSVIYSLRTPSNEPLVTLEYQPKKEKFMQMLGLENKKPEPSEQPYLIEFVEANFPHDKLGLLMAGKPAKDIDLKGANLEDANLTGADLEGANLYRTNLEGANLEDANLTGADLTGANLANAYLANAYLKDANLEGAYLKDANLRDANLRDASLRGANLAGADLSYANLRDANLAGAYLRDAYLRDAYLRDANLRDANLRDASLRGANLTSIKYNDETIWPDGFAPEGVVPKKNPSFDEIQSLPEGFLLNVFENLEGPAAVIIEGAARAGFVMAWYGNERGGGIVDRGVLADLAPQTNSEAIEWAVELFMEITGTQVPTDTLRTDAVTGALVKNVDDLWSSVATNDNTVIEEDDDNQRDFGHYVAMQAMGTGVAWSDNHDKLPFKVPHRETPYIGEQKLIRIAYAVITPESAEDGDYAEQGWWDEEGVEMDDVEEAIRFLKQEGAFEPSSTNFHSGIWYRSYQEPDPRTAAQRELTFHLSGFTKDEERQIFEALTKGRRENPPPVGLPFPAKARGTSATRSPAEAKMSTRLLPARDYYEPDVRALHHALKAGSDVAAYRMALDMAPYVPVDAVLVPMPGRTGHGGAGLLLAQHLAQITGRPVADVLRGRSRPSLYDLKKKGIDPLSIDLGFHLIDNLPEGTPIVVDNVVGTGHTARSALRVIPGALMLVHAVDRGLNARVNPSTREPLDPDL